MNDAEILYTDGHGVNITNYTFEGGGKKYNMEGIMSVRYFTLSKSLAVPSSLIILGALALVAGFLHWMPEYDTIFLAIGAALVVFGIITILLTKKKYVVSITTAEGEKDVIVSTNEHYATQVYQALNKAYLARKNYERPTTVQE